MKSLIKAAPLVIATVLITQPSYAADNISKKEELAIVSSAIIGGLIAGPIGLVVAGVGGALMATADTLEETANIIGDLPIDAVNHADGTNNTNPKVSSAETGAVTTSEKTDSVTIESLTGDSLIPEQLPADIQENAEIAENSVNPTEIQLLFDTNQFGLNPGLKEEMDKIILEIEATPDSLIRIDGYADPRGSEAYNLTLSGKRAESVASYLVNQGIDRARIVIQALGESQSQAAENDFSAYTADRKVHVSIDKSIMAQSTAADTKDKLALNQ